MSKINKRLYRQVAAKMLKLIESGEYPEGSRLPAERVLAERFDVSRPTIREAMIALEAQGYVEVKTGSGVYVSHFREKRTGLNGSVSPFELIESRVYIEGEAAAMAAALITPEQLEALADALKDMSLETPENDTLSTVADRKFHQVISEATNNKVMKLMIEQLWDVQESLDYIKQAHGKACMHDIPRRLAEHRAIYDALAKKDATAARLAMRNHFSRTLTALHETTEQEAVSEVQRKVSKIKERFSMDRMVD